MKPELIEAYRRTSYRVDLPGESIRLRIGERNAAFDAALESYGVESWAFVTAHNPGSRRLPAEENAARERRMIELLRTRGDRFLTAGGVGDDGAWPEERSVLILGIERAEARRLGREFGQTAIVVGVRGGAPELAFCAPADDERMF